MPTADLPLLVLPGRADDERDSVAAAWEERGWPVTRLDRFWDPPQSLPRDQVRLYGDMTFCLIAAQKLDLELLSPPDDLLLNLAEPATWLQRSVALVPLSEAGSVGGTLAPSGGGAFFAKPLAPKLFAAGVFSDTAALAAHTEGFEPETVVFLSEPVTFRNEARCLLLDGRLVSAAFYEGEGDLEAASRFAEAFATAQAERLPRTFVLDVGWIAGRGWAVVEANAVWGAGLNGCDPARMTDCVAVATRPSAATP